MVFKPKVPICQLCGYPIYIARQSNARYCRSCARILRTINERRAARDRYQRKKARGC